MELLVSKQILGVTENCVYRSNKTLSFCYANAAAIIIQFTLSHVYKKTDSSFINLFSNSGRLKVQPITQNISLNKYSVGY